MIVEIFISESDRNDPLSDHGALVVNDEDRVTRIGNGGVESIEQPDAIGDLTQEQRPRIGSEPSPLEIGDDGLGPQGGKVEAVKVTVCHCGGLAT